MNYKPFVSWGVFGAATATERANRFASWGLMGSLPSYMAPVVTGMVWATGKVRHLIGNLTTGRLGKTRA